jgi:hypothetical protein
MKKKEEKKIVKVKPKPKLSKITTKGDNTPPPGKPGGG